MVSTNNSGALSVPSVKSIMWQTNLALLPGLLVLIYFYGTGYLQNLAIAIPAAVFLEASALRLRGRTLRPQTLDGSVVLTAALIALAAPPAVSVLALLTAVATAVLLAKHAYGGIGRNLFNPAMVGYAVALISFPAAFAVWPVPTDGVTAATALDAIKTLEGLTASEFELKDYGFGRYGGYGAEQAGLAFALGGVYLLWKKHSAVRVTAGFLVALTLCAAFGYDYGSSASGGSPGQHLLSGGTLLAAFFVLTDPVTHPSRPLAQWCFGALAAVLTYAIRNLGAYPDGIAFAVLLANAANPLLDHWAGVVNVRRAAVSNSRKNFGPTAESGEEQ